MTIPPEQAAPVSRSHIRVQEYRFSGPLPPPDVIQAYDHIIPGSAERLIVMAEKEQTISHHLLQGQFSSDTQLIDKKLRYYNRGQLFAFIYAMSALILSAIAVLNNHEAFATIFGSATTLGIVTIFIAGHRHKDKDSVTEHKP